MKGKILSLLSFTVFALLVLTSFASAAPSFSNVPTELSTSSIGIQSYTINVSGETSVTPASTILTEGTSSFVITSTYDSILHTINVSYTVPSNFEFKFEKEYSFTLTANDSATTTSTPIKLSFAENTNFYDGENDGDLNIPKIEFEVTEGFGDEDDDYFYPFDEVEVTFEVENDISYDIQNIEIEVCVFDKTAGKCVFDEEDMEITSNKFDLKGGKSEDITMTFQIDADNLKVGNTDYTFYIKAIGEIDDEDSSDDGKAVGGDSAKSIEIVSEDFVIINNIQFNPTTASCGSELTITADVWNIDSSDLKDDEVYVHVYNKELGINQIVEFNSGIDAMESEELSLTVQLSEDVAEKTYAIQLVAYTDDNLDSDDIFESGKGDGEDASYQGLLEVKGSCSTTPTATVSASLQSDAKAGKDLIVKATIVNTDSISKTFKLSASDYADWASSAVLDKTSVTINAGETQDVLVTLKVNKDASGEQSFNLEVVEGDKFLSQPVVVPIEKSLFTFPNITGFFSSLLGEGNGYLLGIVGLNAVLLLVIIFVAIKVVRKK